MYIKDFMKIQENGKTFKKIIVLQCESCQIIHEREYKSYQKSLLNKLYEKDYCNSCWRKTINGQESYRKKMSEKIKSVYEGPSGELKRQKQRDSHNKLYNSEKGELIKKQIKSSMKKIYEGNEGVILRKRISEAVLKAHDDNPQIKEYLSKLSKGKKLGDDNPARRPEVKKKISETRKDKISKGIIKFDITSDKIIKAWKIGKYKNAPVGKCKWFKYTSKNNIVYNVQGTWELKFIKWLDDNNLNFSCHKGRIPYEINNKEHNYYPDFFVYDWNSYVDVKSDHFFNFDKQKFDFIFKSNPDLKLKILMLEDLKNLGIKI